MRSSYKTQAIFKVRSKNSKKTHLVVIIYEHVQIIAPWPTKVTDFFGKFTGHLHCRFKISKQISSNIRKDTSWLQHYNLAVYRRSIFSPGLEALVQNRHSTDSRTHLTFSLVVLLVRQSPVKHLPVWHISFCVSEESVG